MAFSLQHHIPAYLGTKCHTTSSLSCHISPGCAALLPAAPGAAACWPSASRSSCRCHPHSPTAAPRAAPHACSNKKQPRALSDCRQDLLDSGTSLTPHVCSGTHQQSTKLLKKALPAALLPLTQMLSPLCTAAKAKFTWYHYEQQPSH
jgi:hypothetical protein